MSRVAFIMAGGTGERFWPLSRASRPKQLLKLTNPNQTLLEESILRIEPLVGRDSVYVITGKSLEEPVLEANLLPRSHIWAEPSKKNTLGALVWVAANLLAQERSDSTLAILTADHKIVNPEEFRKMVDLAMQTAEETGGLVTCGIVPTRPETGYGYIEIDRTKSSPSGVLKSQAFREKPDSETALEFFQSGNYLWNSGMFFWTLEGFLRELEQAQPEAFRILHEIAKALSQDNFDAAKFSFEELPNLSVDYGLMEKASEVWVVEGRFGWDDVGAWDSIPRSMEVLAGETVSLGDVLAIDCKDSVFYNESNLKIAAVGIEGLIAVATEDALLLVPKDQAQRVKEIVSKLKESSSELLD